MEYKGPVTEKIYGNKVPEVEGDEIKNKMLSFALENNRIISISIAKLLNKQMKEKNTR